MAGPDEERTRRRVHVRWRDLDTLGHLNSSVYHEYLEEGRGALVAGLGDDPADPFPWVLAHIELDYRHEVRREHGYVEIVTGVERVGSKSVTTTQRVLLPDGTVAAEGRAIIVAWDGRARGSRPLGERERAVLGGLAAADG
ncbi:acyl-CoA thioesterase [Baekduia soli]|uniref:Acyl-CoA thioesterase n=1 Tax=Baekduia soli TaxID=496014 RepID=A0A5B8U2J2_9ACTN|nr:acyl-CoA thioesterase [Baekduia soli]QEC47193.1 acyl-CoA thioesterase [Baekduia soli]